MNTNALNKQYEHLTPVERIRLTVKAKAREDQQEIDLLRHSCPRYCYTEPDAEVQDRWSALAIVTSNVMMHLVNAAQEIKRLDGWATTLRSVKPFVCDLAESLWFDGFYEGGSETRDDEGPSKAVRKVNEMIERVWLDKDIEKQASVLARRAAIEWQVVVNFIQKEMAIEENELLDGFGEEDIRDSIRFVLARANDGVVSDQECGLEAFRADLEVRYPNVWANLSKGLIGG